MRVHSGKKCFMNRVKLFLFWVIFSGDRPYACSFCDSRFTNSSSLVVHLRTHTGERPYQCQVCKKGFIKSYGLKQHKKTNAACNVVDKDSAVNKDSKSIV